MSVVTRPIVQRSTVHRQARRVSALLLGLLLLPMVFPALAAAPLKVGGLPVT